MRGPTTRAAEPCPSAQPDWNSLIRSNPHNNTREAPDAEGFSCNDARKHRIHVLNTLRRGGVRLTAKRPEGLRRADGQERRLGTHLQNVETGCEYIRVRDGVTPRLTADGKVMCGLSK